MWFARPGRRVRLQKSLTRGLVKPMDESKAASPQPDLPVSLPDPLASAKTPATERAQRLASALRDNLRRRKAAAGPGKAAKPSN